MKTFFDGVEEDGDEGGGEEADCGEEEDDEKEEEGVGMRQKILMKNEADCRGRREFKNCVEFSKFKKGETSEV